VQDGDDDPTCSTASGAGMLCVEQAVELQSTLAVAGNSTLSGTLTLSDELVMGGNDIGGQLTGFEDLTANDTMAITDCGRTVTTNDASRTITLPAVAAGNKGCRITFVMTGANDFGLVSISPNASDGIFGICCGVNDAATTACVALSGTDDKDLEAVAAEVNKGDNVTLISDGSTGWYAVGCVGAGWASES